MKEAIRITEANAIEHERMALEKRQLLGVLTTSLAKIEREIWYRNRLKSQEAQRLEASERRARQKATEELEVVEASRRWEEWKAAERRERESKEAEFRKLVAEAELRRKEKEKFLAEEERSRQKHLSGDGGVTTMVRKGMLGIKLHGHRKIAAKYMLSEARRCCPAVYGTMSLEELCDRWATLGGLTATYNVITGSKPRDKAELNGALGVLKEVFGR